MGGIEERGLGNSADVTELGLRSHSRPNKF